MKTNIRTTLPALSALFFLCLAAMADAHPITVDPGGYTGNWFVSGQTASTARGATINLATDNYFLSLDTFEPGNEFAFLVAVDGGVSVSQSSQGLAADGGASVVTFRNATVTIDPAPYTSQWFIGGGGTTSFSGPATVILEPAIRYQTLLGNFGLGNRFDWDFFDDGTVAVLNNISAVGGISTLTFNTVDVLLEADMNSAITGDCA